MFEKWRIKEHMEVSDAAGRHIGTVDEVEDNRIKLTRSDSADGAHHYLDWESVDRIEDNRVYLKAGTPLPAGREGTLSETESGTGTGMAGDLSGGPGAGTTSGSGVR